MNAEQRATSRHPSPHGARFGVAAMLAAVGRTQPGQLGQTPPAPFLKDQWEFSSGPFRLAMGNDTGTNNHGLKNFA